MALEREEKKVLLVNYFNNILEKRVLNYNQQRELEKEIMLHVPGAELYELIKEIYPSLNKKHNFDINPIKSEKPGMLSSCILSLIRRYHADEVQKTKEKAKKSTLLFCLFIITIPFALLFYNRMIRKYHEQQTFQELFVDESYLKLADKHINEGNSIRESSYKKMYGLSDKMVLNFQRKEPKPVSDVLFSKKGRIRKHISSSEGGFYGRYGINLLGTKEQINDALIKFKSYR